MGNDITFMIYSVLQNTYLVGFQIRFNIFHTNFYKIRNNS